MPENTLEVGVVEEAPVVDTPEGVDEAEEENKGR